MSSTDDAADNPPTILVVDDEPSIRELVAEVLELEGFAVTQAPDGQAALEAVEEDGVDVIVSDVRMPRLDGGALVRRLRQRGHKIPVVLMSAVYADVDLPDVHFLPKPFAFERLLTMVGTALSSAPHP